MSHGRLLYPSRNLRYIALTYRLIPHTKERLLLWHLLHSYEKDSRFPMALDISFRLTIDSLVL